MATNLERWTGKVALVTGASAGIGDALARRLGDVGMKVAIAARRADRLKTLAEAIRANGGAVLALPVDLTDMDAISAMFGKIREAWGGVDVLINNAGLALNTSFGEGDPQDWDRMLDLNVRALSRCMREALRDMASKPEGQIVNISSLAGHRVPPGYGNTYYSASKHAVKALTDGLRMELVENGSPVRVGMISPGMVETEIFGVYHRDEAKGREVLSQFKVLEADDIADAALYMLSTPPHVAIHDIFIRPKAQAH